MVGSYLLIPLLSLCFFLYAVSLVFVQLEIFPKNIHNKIWNTLLAGTFISSAILGLVLVVQINYKLNIPYIKEILKWHVNLGITMSIIGLIHFLKHWNYYKDLFTHYHRYSSEKEYNTEIGYFYSNSKIVFISVLLGFSTIVFQVLVLREMINLLSGNELISGFVLATWMALTGLGAIVNIRERSKKILINIIPQVLIWLGIIPLLIVSLLYFSKWLFFPPGILVDIRYSFGIMVILLIPYCIVSGYLFSVLVQLFDKKLHPFRTDALYSFETAGSLLGGIVISVIFIFWFTTMRTLAILLVIQIISSYLLVDKSNKETLIKYIIGLFIAAVLFLLPLDTWLKSLVFPGQKIVKNTETPYGNMVIAQKDNQFSVFSDHNLLYTTDNIIENEECVHYPMLQHRFPQNVLLVSGGNTGLLKEILKYPGVEQIDFVVENKWLITETNLNDSVLKDPRINRISTNARKHLTKYRQFYDIVIINTGEPVSLMQNRFYTLEFFRKLSICCDSSAIISLALPTIGNYGSAEMVKRHKLIYNTLKAVFNNVVVIQGEKDYFIASQRELSTAIGQLSLSGKIHNVYVNSDYIDDFSITMRSKQIMERLEGDYLLNHDYYPRAVFLNTNLFLSLFSAKELVLLIPLLLLLLPLFWIDRFDLSMYIAGFSISSFEIIMILGFQIIFGYVYAASGVIFAICMMGIALGSKFGSNQLLVPEVKQITFLQIVIGIIIGLFTLGLVFLPFTWPSYLQYFLVFLGSIIPSIMIGIQFSHIVKYKLSTGFSASGRIYGIDLLGSALGAFSVSAFLVPSLGFVYTGLLIFLLNIFSGLFLLIPKRY